MDIIVFTNKHIIQQDLQFLHLKTLFSRNKKKKRKNKEIINTKL